MPIGALCRAAALCAGALFALPSCTILKGPKTSDGYVEARPSPGVYDGPRAYYAGETHYWHGDRWWYESKRGWAYLQTEPAPLYRYRVQRHRPGIAAPTPAAQGGGPPAYVAPLR